MIKKGETISVEEFDGYAVVTLNRPREMNSISLAMTGELEDCFLGLEKNDSINAIMLTGGELVFSAGMDIKEMNELSDEQIEEYFQAVSRYLIKIYSCKKPLVAAVGGIALGGGFNLVTVCDIIVASESAIFGHPEIKFGLNPLFYPLMNIVGMSKAKEVIMLGEPLGAHEALRIGLVNRVVSPENLMTESLKIVKELAGHSPKALSAVKRISEIAPKLDKAAAIEMEIGTSALLFLSAELRSDLRNTLQKTKENKA
ncbi:MAG: enoyl-CoA hydratase/isomerase family protein [Deltaproteobacteria bacterium]|nr:enoyl-CoA hydratase/isomerase family protein [Deltaproteobacteria bacterium]